jgi:hypothetical protein
MAITHTARQAPAPAGMAVPAAPNTTIRVPLSTRPMKRAAALERYRYFGYRRGEAETLNSLGELASRTAATSQARDHHTQALTIARDIGAPLEEARALEGIGRSHLHDNDIEEGSASLRQALTIYRRIGAPDGVRVQETLHHHRLTASSAPRPR